MGIEEVRVAVIGLGVAGAAAAWRIAEQSSDVIAIEQHSNPAVWGASSGGTRLIRSIAAAGETYVRLGAQARELWSELDLLAVSPLQRRVGLLLIAPRTDSLMNEAVSEADRYGLDAHLLRGSDRSEIGGSQVLEDDDLALYEPGATVVPSELAVRTMVDRAQQLGVSVLLGRVERLRPLDGFVELVVADQVVRARHVVVAAGAWLPKLVPDVSVQIERSVMHWFHPAEPDTNGSVRPAFIRTTRDSGPFGGMPGHFDDARMKVMRTTGAPISGVSALDRSVMPSDVNPVEHYVKHHMRDLRPTVDESMVCAFTTARDKHFLVGTPPYAPSSVVLLGALSGSGFKYAPALGELVARAVVQTDAQAIPSLLRADRLSATVP